MQDLEVVLSYQNPDVVLRFSEDHHVSLADANEIFIEMKRWLWFSARRLKAIEAGAENFAIPLFDEVLAIDLMWHTFILYTRDYAEFCENMFGFFLHHTPKSQAEQVAWDLRVSTNAEEAMAERLKDLRKVYESIFNELGPQVLLKWCEEFPTRFAHFK